MSIDDGGPAFPGKQPIARSHTGFGPLEEWKSGMSLRDWFAGKALCSLIAEFQDNESVGKNDIARWAYSYADAMIKAGNNSSN